MAKASGAKASSGSRAELLQELREGSELEQGPHEQQVTQQGGELQGRELQGSQMRVGQLQGGEQQGSQSHGDQTQAGQLQDDLQDSVELSQFDGLFKKMERFTVAGPSEKQTQSLIALAATYANTPAGDADRAVQHGGEARQPGYNQRLRSRLAQRLLQRPQQELPRMPIMLTLMHRMVVQAKTMHWLFWLLSAAIIGAGVMLEAAASRGNFAGVGGAGGIGGQPEWLLITCLLLPVASVAYALRSMHTPMSELEATFPVTPVQLMMARIGTVLLYNIVLCLASYGLLYLAGLESGNGVLLTELLVPICLSTFAALAAMLRFGTWAGTVLILSAGVIQFVAQDKLGVFHLFSSYGSTYWLPSKLLACALMLALLAWSGTLLRTHRYHR